MEKLIPLITIILVMICFFGYRVDAEDNDFFMRGVDIVNTDVNITVKGDITLDVNSVLKNNGEIELRNSQLAYLTLNSDSNYHTEKGFLRFTGSSDLVVTGNYPYINNVSVELESGDVFCDNNLTIGGYLHLKNGIVNLPDDGILKMHSAEPLSVFHHNKNSFVQGRLQRSTLTGESYEFPVGSDNSYHLFKVSEVTASTDVDVRFDTDVYNDWSPYENKYKTHVLRDGGWRVNANQNTKYQIGMSLDYMEDPIVSASNLVAVRMDQSEFPVGVWDYYNDATSIAGQWIDVEKHTGSGVYTAAVVEGLTYVNLIVIGRGADTRFTIGNVERFIKRKITIYNRWGQLLYKTNLYDNEYDANGLPQGTYFFVFEYDDGNINGTESSFFEVKYED